MRRPAIWAAALLITLPMTIGTLGGCASASCPSPVPLDSLPQLIASRVNRALPDETRVSRAVPSDPASDLIIRLASFEAVRPTLHALDRAAVLSMTRRGEHWTIPVTVVAVDGTEQTIDFKLDTGAHTQLAVDSGTARRLGVVVPRELPIGTTHTAFGPKRIHTGVLGSIHLGHAILGPVEVEIECSGRSYTPLIGIKTLEKFGHAIFDWSNATLTLLPRGFNARTEQAATHPGWTTTPWTSGPVAVHRDSIEHAGEGRKRVLVEMTARWAWLTIDNQEHVALIDTGFSGDLFSFEPLGASSLRSGKIVGQGFGRRDTFRTQDLAEPVRIGAQTDPTSGLEFEGLTLIEPVTDFGNMNLVQRAGFGVMAGLGVLERFPLWLDFERGEIRFWTGDGSMPRPAEEED